MAEKLTELLAPFKDKYYKVFDRDTNAKLLAAPLGKKLTSDRPLGTMKVDFVVAKGHPLFYHHLWGYPIPVTYFEVQVINPQPPIQRCSFTYWAREIVKLRKVTAESPEFNQQLLAFMATKDKCREVREYAVELLEPRNHSVLYQIATNDPEPNVCGRAIRKLPAELYKDFLRHVLLDANKKYSNGAMRVYALEKLDSETDHQLIAEVAEKGGEDWIRVLATEKINPELYPDLILRLSYQKTTVGDIANAAMKKLDPVKHRTRLIEIILEEPDHLFNQYKIVQVAKLLARGIQMQPEP